MSEETTTEAAAKTVDVAAPPPKLSRMQSAWAYLTRLPEGVAWLTDKMIALLRLFAVAALFLIVVFVVFSAIRSAKTLVVKPFSVPQSMMVAQSDSGRIIANILKERLIEEEKKIAQNVRQGRNDEGKMPEPAPITSNLQTYMQGANIKLPETGISIDDVVEFIAGIFGRETLSGSVYETSDKLSLQVELQDRIFELERPLKNPDGTPRTDKSHAALLLEMLDESRKKVLGVASERYNLYYYCTDEVGDIEIEHDSNQYQALFDDCTQLGSRDLTTGTLKVLRDKLNAFPVKTINDQPLPAYILTAIKGKVQGKLDLLSRTDIAAAAPSPAPTGALPKATSFALPSSTVLFPSDPLTKAFPVLPLVKQLDLACFSGAEPPIADSEAVHLSTQAEGDATLLFRNRLYNDAEKKYAEAIQQNCRNAVAWANLGILHTAAEQGGIRDLPQALLALQRATQLNNKVGWMQHSLCLAEAFGADDPVLENALNNDSCKQARILEPAKTVLYDKLFQIAVGDKYFRDGKYPQAFVAYQKSMQTDKKRDCRMSGVLKQLGLLATQHRIQGAGSAACDIIKAAYTLPDTPPSECDADLTSFAGTCN